MEKADVLYDRLRQATALLRAMPLAGLSPSDVSVNNIGFADRGEDYIVDYVDYEGDCMKRSLYQHLNRLFLKNKMITFKPAADAIV